MLEGAFAAAASCDLFLAVGTSLAVQPAALVAAVAHREGARLVIVNQGETPLDDRAEAVLRGAIGEVLPTIVREGGAQVADREPADEGSDLGLSECWFCGREISLSEPYLSVNYDIERMDEPGYVDVERAAALLVACIDHAPSLDELAGAFTAAGYPVLLPDDGL